MISRCSFLSDQPSVHEVDGQIIEQLRMRRRIGAGAEVAGRANEPLAEMMQPDAIDDDARRERIVLAGDGPGHSSRPLPCVKRRRVESDRQLRKCGLHLIARIPRISPQKHALSLNARRIDQHHRPRGAPPGCWP